MQRLLWRMMPTRSPILPRPQKMQQKLPLRTLPKLMRPLIPQRKQPKPTSQQRKLPRQQELPPMLPQRRLPIQASRSLPTRPLLKRAAQLPIPQLFPRCLTRCRRVISRSSNPPTAKNITLSSRWTFSKLTSTSSVQRIHSFTR